MRLTRPIALVWLERDLRLSDNPALRHALLQGFAVVPVFLWSPDEEAPWAPGAASRWWLHQALSRLQQQLDSMGAPLVIRRGPIAQELSRLAQQAGASHIFWNRRYEPAALARNQRIRDHLKSKGIAFQDFQGNVLFEPGSVRNQTGRPFQVFTAFWKRCRELSPPLPQPAPLNFPVAAGHLPSLALSELKLEPVIDWASRFRETWSHTATQALRLFLADRMEAYVAQRDFPAELGTSRLSPFLASGELSVREAFAAAAKLPGSEGFLRQLGWREFSYHLLFHFPETASQPLRHEFRDFPWRMDGVGFKAWTQGNTGYPLVDAGMRELWSTGWMHNRVRMAVASFLVKHLLIPWQEGSLWFWDTLVDADLANNTMGWQWTAGCGADAAPYFRIFNPVRQSEKFDPHGVYLRRWIPELASVPEVHIHEPWNAPSLEQLNSGVEAANRYPAPIVEHSFARNRALAALQRIRRTP